MKSIADKDNIAAFLFHMNLFSDGSYYKHFTICNLIIYLFYLFIFKIHQACNRLTISISKIYYVVSRKRLKGLSLVLAGSWI